MKTISEITPNETLENERTHRNHAPSDFLTNWTLKASRAVNNDYFDD